MKKEDTRRLFKKLQDGDMDRKVTFSNGHEITIFTITENTRTTLKSVSVDGKEIMREEHDV